MRELDGVDFSILMGFVQVVAREGRPDDGIIAEYRQKLRTDEARVLLDDLTDSAGDHKQDRAKFVLEMAGLQSWNP